MGAFYANITVRGPEPAEILAFLRREGRESIVSPRIDDCIVVYDLEGDNQDEQALGKLASQLSQQFDCGALALLNHDDDVLWFQVYRSGAQLDEYNSCPGYFGTLASDVGPAGGNASLLCEIFRRRDAIPEVKRILQSRDYVLATDRHKDLAAVLKLPAVSVGLGFQDLNMSIELPTGFSSTEIE